MKLFMILIGCKPKSRHTEQHDIFFGIAENIKDLIPEMIAFWPEAEGNMHADGWREVTVVNNFNIQIEERKNFVEQNSSSNKLFFINLGGYKKGEFEEFHYKVLAVAADKGDAVTQSKQTAFFKHTFFEDAKSHIDDKYGIDVDDIYDIEDILTPDTKNKYYIVISPATESKEDILHIGYFKLDKL